jgi:predicted DNA-binding transcriptional regulator AlpA
MTITATKQHPKTYDPHSRFVDTPGAVRHLDGLVTESTLEKWRLGTNGPPYIKLGPRRVVYERQALDEWAANRRRQSTTEAVA